MQLLTLVLSVLKLVYHLPLVRMLSQSLTAVQPKGIGLSTSFYQSFLFLFLSCVDCLDTEGACGWCLYGGTCSGVSEVCPTPEGVNNSYLTVSPQPYVENFVISHLHSLAESLDLLKCVLL